MADSKNTIASVLKVKIEDIKNNPLAKNIRPENRADYEGKLKRLEDFLKIENGTATQVKDAAKLIKQITDMVVASTNTIDKKNQSAINKQQNIIRNNKINGKDVGYNSQDWRIEQDGKLVSINDYSKRHKFSDLDPSKLQLTQTGLQHRQIEWINGLKPEALFKLLGGRKQFDTDINNAFVTAVTKLSGRKQTEVTNDEALSKQYWDEAAETVADTIKKKLKADIIAGKPNGTYEKYNSAAVNERLANRQEKEKTGLLKNLKSRQNKTILANQELNKLQGIEGLPEDQQRAAKELNDIGQNATNNAEEYVAEKEEESKALKEQEKLLKEADAAQKELDKNAQTAAKIRGASLEKERNALAKSIKALSLYTIVTRKAIQVVRSSINTVRQLDKSLTEQAMVTGLSREQAYSLLTTYQDLAQQVGATTKEVAEASSEFIKQGKSIDDAITLSKAAVSAAKVAGISVSNSINYLTTALNGFKLNADQAMAVSDKFAAVAAQSATGYDELAIALSKVASQANLAGMSIDYTTALLATGLETTREAPETMGTALKTIIARMREITDYGKTLDDSTTVNNVEEQLAYIGIALKDQNGELRSTEDVLDDLGKKWNSLSANQQAAVAKALAGTRQQSRLIAMMDNYDRVLELQETSLKSSGATAAQLSKYMKGYEAQLNNIQVAWEKIVETFTNSDVINYVLKTVSEVLDDVNTIFQNNVAQVALITTLGYMLTQIVGQRMLEKQIAEQEAEFTRQSRIEMLEKRQLAISATALQEQTNKGLATEVKAQSSITENMARQAKLRNANLKSKQDGTAVDQGLIEDSLETAQEGKEVAKETAAAAAETALSQEEINNLLGANSNLAKEYASNQAMIALLQKDSFNFSSKTLLLTALIGKFKKAEAAWEQLKLLLTKQTTLELAKQKVAMGSVLALVEIIATAVIALTAGVVKLTKYLMSLAPTTTNVAKNVGELTNEIYDLNTNITKLKSGVDVFNEIDNKIIKTTEDAKELKEALAAAADGLTDEEKKIYNNLSDSEKKDYLKSKIKEKNKEVDEKWIKAMGEINRLSYSDRAKMLGNMDNLSNTKERDQAATLQSAVSAYANKKFYEAADNLTSLTTSERLEFEELGQSILGAMGAQTKYNLAQSGGIKALADAMVEQEEYVKVLSDTSSSIADQIKAYDELSDALGKVSPAAAKALEKLYPQQEFFHNLSADAVSFLDEMNASADEINKLWDAFNGAGKDKKAFAAFLGTMYGDIEDLGTNLGIALHNLGYNLDELDKDSKEYADAIKIINSFADAFGVTILDMGQNMDSLTSKIDNIYKKASEWNTLSESEKAEFINDNAALFSGEDGAKLLTAFQQGDYDVIRAALETNEQLKQTRDQRLKDIEIALATQKQLGDEANKAYVAQLEKEKKLLEDEAKLFSASLETRLKQEQDRLDTYKNYLQDQESALKESLDKRKEAYQNYFDTVKEQEEDEDYEKQAKLLVSNLSKIGSTTDAASVAQKNELQQKLQDLEEERLKTLRERAQESALSSIDDEVDAISKKFDDLLDNNRMMLAALQGELGANSGSLLASMIGSRVSQGVTANELEEYLRTLQTNYGSYLNGLDLSNISIQPGANNSLVLNVNGQSYSLNSSDEKSLYNSIIQALRQLGIK